MVPPAGPPFSGACLITIRRFSTSFPFRVFPVPTVPIQLTGFSRSHLTPLHSPSPSMHLNPNSSCKNVSTVALRGPFYLLPPQPLGHRGSAPILPSSHGNNVSPPGIFPPPCSSFFVLAIPPPHCGPSCGDTRVRSCRIFPSFRLLSPPFGTRRAFRSHFH